MPTVKELVSYAREKGARYFGSENIWPMDIVNARPVFIAGENDVTFVGSSAKDPHRLIDETGACLVVINEDFHAYAAERLSRDPNRGYLVVSNARAMFLRVVRDFFQPPMAYEISEYARIHKSATVGNGCHIGDFCVIGENVSIGNKTVIHSAVQIHAGARIGANVIIHSGTVIGADGFGYERNEHGQLEKFPHIGSVVIEDDVEIGANTCIDRGTLGDTHIARGAKIDNLCHISHNVRIGSHSAVIAHAMIGGSTVIGDQSWIAPSACLRDGLTIGNRVTVGLAALVTKNVPDGITVVGNPARDMNDHNKLMKHLSKVIGE